MRRSFILSAWLSALILGACSLTQNLDDLKANADQDAGAAASGGSGGGDAQAKLCEKGVDCTGCADCTTFCQCGAPPSGFDGCMAVCQGGSDAGGAGGMAGTGGSGGTAGTGGAAGANAGVDCGSVHCDPGGACCITSTNAACDNQCNGVVVSCDGPEDCGDAEVCCGTMVGAGSYTEIKCSTTCTDTNKTVVCHTPQDCPPGKDCTASAVLPGYSMCN